MNAREHIVKQEYLELDQPEVLDKLFYPRAEPRDETPSGCTDHTIEVVKGVSVGGRFHLNEDEECPSILFFHGNGETVGDYDEIGPMYVAQGVSLLAVDYRGYGWSGGTPSVTSMVRDCYVIFDYVKEYLAAEGRTGNLLVMGRSLGCVSALELAAFKGSDFAGLIIESGFAHTRPVLTAMGVDVDGLGITEEKGFGNILKIKGFAKPTLILHASNDQIIPVSEAGLLQAESPAAGKELQMIPGADHNNIIARTGRMYFEVIARFVRRAGQPARRKKRGVR